MQEDPDKELLLKLKHANYVRPEKRGRLAALLKQAQERTRLAPDAPAPQTQALLSELALEPSEQALDAWAERLEGAPIIDVAHKLGVSINTARKLLAEVHSALAEDLKANLELNRALDLGRVDALIKAYFTDAKEGDQDAAKLILKCLQHRAELTGTNAKAQPSPTGPTNVLVWIQQQLPSINALVDQLPP